MQIVIDISEEIYDDIKNHSGVAYVIEGHLYEVEWAIKKGKPLPKGHGRLKDVDWIDDNCHDYRTEDGAWCYKWEDINSAPTIIEADKAESEGKE